MAQFSAFSEQNHPAIAMQRNGSQKIDSEDHHDLPTSKNALLELATKRSYSVSQILVQHEVQTFEECFASIRRSPAFRESCIEVIRVALKNENYDLVRRIFAEIQNLENFFNDQPSVLNDAIASGLEGLHDSTDMTHGPTRLEIVEFLLLHNAPVNSCDEDDRSPFRQTCEFGLFEAHKCLLNHGGDLGMVVRSTENPRAPLNLLELTLMKLKLRNSMWITSGYWERKLSAGYICIALHLLSCGLRTKPRNADLTQFFWTLCYRGDVENAKRLYQVGASLESVTGPSQRTFWPGTAMHAAIEGGHPEVVQFLLDLGFQPSLKANCERRGGIGRKLVTPLVIGAQSKLSLKANSGRSRSMGHEPITSIVYAVQLFNRNSISKGNVEFPYDACELLVAAGAEEADGKILLEECVRRGWLERSKRLMQRGVRIEEIPECQNTELIDLLCEYGARLDGPKMLDFALRGHFELVRYLHEKRAIVIDRGNFAYIAQFLILRADFDGRRWQQVMSLLNYFFGILGCDVNTVFAVQVNEEEEIWKGVIRHDRLEAHLVERDWPSQGELTNMLRLACRWYKLRALSVLLQAGARLDSPELPETALVYYARRLATPKDSRNRADEHILRLLMEPATESVMEDFRSNFAAELERFEDQLLRLKYTLTEESESSDESDGIVSEPAGKTLGTTLSTGTFADIAARDQSTALLPYRHLQLQGPRAIRLLVIEPALRPDEPIVCNTHRFELHEAPGFEALSYVWGDLCDTVPIQIDMMLMEITRNLYAALKRLRKSEGARYIWADAICIDQGNNEEKSRQVSIMGDIYGRAERTVIWVGEHANNSHLVFEHLQKWHDWCDEHDAGRVANDKNRRSEVDPYPWNVKRAFDVFTQRPWFYRTWVLQEVALAKDAILLCGPDSSELEYILRATGDRENVGFHPFRGRDSVTRFRSIVALRTGRQKRHVPNVIKVSRFCKATEAKDKVYAIFSLLELPPLPIDYGFSVERIYRDFTQAIMLQYGNIQSLHWLGTAQSSLSLPSWVPDWSIAAPIGCLPRSMSDISLYESEFPSKCIGDLRFSDDNMTIRGKMFDEICNLSDELAVKEECKPGTRGFFNVFRSWEELLLPLIEKRGLSALQALSRTLQGIDQYCTARSSHPEVYWYGYILWDLHCGAGIIRSTVPEHFKQAKLMMEILWQHHCQEDVKQNFAVYADVMEINCYGRKLLTTRNGSLGLAPPRAEIGDSLVFFPGGWYAFVVRPLDGGNYELIGDCFLEDLDVMALFREDSEILMQEFTLC